MCGNKLEVEKKDRGQGFGSAGACTVSSSDCSEALAGDAKLAFVWFFFRGALPLVNGTGARPQSYTARRGAMLEATHAGLAIASDPLTSCLQNGMPEKVRLVGRVKIRRLG